jgi:hypothetical protein
MAANKQKTIVSRSKSVAHLRIRRPFGSRWILYGNSSDSAESVFSYEFSPEDTRDFGRNPGNFTDIEFTEYIMNKKRRFRSFVVVFILRNSSAFSVVNWW